MRIAIDWSHTKDLTTYDGKKVKVESLKQLLARIGRNGDESKGAVETTDIFQSPSAILEQGCPMSFLCYAVFCNVQWLGCQ